MLLGTIRYSSSKIEEPPSSIFEAENRRTPHLRSSKPKIEGPLTFVARSRRSKTAASSIFGFEDRRAPHLRSSGPKIEELPLFSTFGAENWVEDRHGARGWRHTAGWRGGIRQNGTPTDRFAEMTAVPRTLQGIEQARPQRRCFLINEMVWRTPRHRAGPEDTTTTTR